MYITWFSRKLWTIILDIITKFKWSAFISISLLKEMLKIFFEWNKYIHVIVNILHDDINLKLCSNSFLYATYFFSLLKCCLHLFDIAVRKKLKMNVSFCVTIKQTKTIQRKLFLFFSFISSFYRKHYFSLLHNTNKNYILE